MTIILKSAHIIEQVCSFRGSAVAASCRVSSLDLTHPPPTAAHPSPLPNHQTTLGSDVVAIRDEEPFLDEREHVAFESYHNSQLFMF